MVFSILGRNIFFAHDSLQIISLKIQRRMFVNVSLVTENVCVRNEKERRHTCFKFLAMQKRYSPTRCSLIHYQNIALVMQYNTKKVNVIYTTCVYMCSPIFRTVPNIYRLQQSNKFKRQ